jgi:hypothetical protein
MLGLFERIRRITELHGDTLWWAHSAYALLLGVVVMWLGSRHFAYLRIVIFHIAFIWISSLFLPAAAGLRRLSPVWQGRLRLVVNYFNKNFYQQLLFFVLPIYYASATLGSKNFIFVVLIAISAVVSTLDIVYDRYVATRWPLTAGFFAFNVFACINVMLPVLWGVSNRWALWISAALTLAGFTSILYRLSGWGKPHVRWALVGAAISLFTAVYYLRPFIPPAPLCLVKAEFGRSVNALRVSGPIDPTPEVAAGKIVAMTAIRAPMGLRENVRHCWYIGGRLVYASPYYSLVGGREDGYRVWTQISWKDALSRDKLVVDVETGGGQLIGRARLLN